MTPQQLPAKGVLDVTFHSDKRPSLDCAPLGTSAFDALWTAMTNPARLTAAAAALAAGVARAATASGGGGGWGRSGAGVQASGGGVVLGGGDGLQRPSTWGTVDAAQSAGRGSDAAAGWPRSQHPATVRGSTALLLPPLPPPHGGRGAGGGHVRAVTDCWKMGLLHVLASNCYFTAQQVSLSSCMPARVRGASACMHSASCVHCHSPLHAWPYGTTTDARGPRKSRPQRPCNSDHACCCACMRRRVT